MVNDVPFLADAVRRTPAKAGLNIEGLAWTPEGHLLVGLRAPTVTESEPRPHGGQEDAVVLRLKNPEALFAEPRQPAQLGEVVKLDLRGQGIRGMCGDPDRKGDSCPHFARAAQAGMIVRATARPATITARANLAHRLPGAAR